LPVVVAGYFVCHRLARPGIANLWLLFSSLFFYSWWNPKYLPLILASIVINYSVGSRLSRAAESETERKRKLLLFGVAFNVGGLAYFKYTDFILGNVNVLFGLEIASQQIELPLAISFFTFQQIAYLVDSHRRETQEYDFTNYGVFVSFFPQLIAGPIVHHKEMMPQFRSARSGRAQSSNLALGLYVFAMGLFKKAIIADTLATWANVGYGAADQLSFVEAWLTSLAYSGQLYFDFSGYTDMAIGAALLFNIRLPDNFNSPYKARDIQEFWRRWHMTLSRFLRDYVYIPLGGNRGGPGKTERNLVLTFLIGGIWHGAGWTFAVWGLLHGGALVVLRRWKNAGFSLPDWLAWFVTFQFVNIAWVFFRAESWEDAFHLLRAMAGMTGILIPRWVANAYPFLYDWGFRAGTWLLPDGRMAGICVVSALLIALFAPNSNELRDRFSPTKTNCVKASALAVVGLFSLTQLSEFLYFQF
jgi:D-alanyl-lipoteichoic acid acyltransferase DltB (MBOAT superfamily)